MCISTLRICILVYPLWGFVLLWDYNIWEGSSVLRFFIKNFCHFVSLVILPLYLCCFLFCCVLKAECVSKLDVYRIMHILEYNTDNQCFFMGYCSVCSATVVPSFICMQQKLKLLFKTAFPKLLSHYIWFNLIFFRCKRKRRKTMRKKRKQQVSFLLILYF